MGAFAVSGGKNLSGEVRASGSKNAALPLMAASLLTDGEVILKNVPRISDVADMADILRFLGATVKREGDALVICARGVSSCDMPRALSEKIRSSIFLLGPMLARMREAHFFLPGGCRIGKRPVDQHIMALGRMGAETLCAADEIICRTAGLQGAVIDLKCPSVGATENALLAAAAAEGVTVINGAAREPEIRCLAELLRRMGAGISGDGGCRITVKGAKRLTGAEIACIPDRIETCTFLAAAAAAGGRAIVTHTDPSQFECVTRVFIDMGARLRVFRDSVEIVMSGRPKAADMITRPYPGFPTDMQAQMCAVACRARGVSHITETVFESRLGHAQEMAKCGALVGRYGSGLAISGCARLKAADFCAADLRGGAALSVLALACGGRSRIFGTEYIDRGYERFEEKLRMLGADISRI